MISGLKIKRRKNGEVLAILSPGRTPYGRQRGRWCRREYFRYAGWHHRTHPIEYVWAMMEADEQFWEADY